MPEPEYGYYLVKDVEENYRMGLHRGLCGGFAIGAICCVLTAFVCYQQFGPPSKVPNLSLLIGDVQRVKDDVEGMAYSIKSRWRSRIISEGDCRDGAERYRQVASSFNGVVATLEAMLSAGHDDKSVASIKDAMSDAEQRYQSLRGWCSSLPKEILKVQPARPTPRADGPIVYGALPDGAIQDVTSAGLDLAKHFYDGMKEMDKLKRDHLIGMLHDLRFKPWPAIPE